MNQSSTLDLSRLRPPPRRVYCRLCGVFLPYYQRGSGAAQHRTRLACSRECAVVLALSPHVTAGLERRTAPSRQGVCVPHGSTFVFPGRSGIRLEDLCLLPFDLEAHRRAVDLSGLGIKPLFITIGRGKKLDTIDPASLPLTIWGATSHGTRTAAALRFIAKKGGEVSLIIDRHEDEDGRQAFMRYFFGGDNEAAMSYLSAFDVVLAWTCSCPISTKWSIIDAEQIPREDGFHGACPGCGAVAVRVQKRGTAYHEEEVIA